MSEIFTGEYSDLRAAATASMRDKCKIGTRIASATVDPSNVSYTYGTEKSCGLLIKTRGELAADGSQATLTDALLRLPWGTAITSTDRVQITEQGGDAKTDVYAVDGAPYQSLINVTVRLKRITGNSTS
jgi:hypothetical protein